MQHAHPSSDPMTSSTYYWHDCETFGTDPQQDAACQFAGIRTDSDFNVIGEPVVLYCKTPEDYLPNPEACLVTGISPQTATEKGLCEAQFIAEIHAEMAKPQTCCLGYNSIRFDDEVTRNLLYRNFYDPYAREWQNGNSRWDLIDIARTAYALRPEGINWPTNEEGVASFRLEQITQANGISHQAAHDALSDVYATIALARLIRQKQPKLYDYLLANRYKPAVLKQLNTGSFTPLVHVSGRFPARNNHLAIIVPICTHPTNQNEVVVFDLSSDPEPLFTLDADAIRKRLFVANEDLAPGIERIPLKTVHVNKSPVLAPISVIRPQDAERLELNIAKCHNNLNRIRDSVGSGLKQKLADVFTRHFDDTPTDPDLMIYSGGFFGHKDKAEMEKIRRTQPQQLVGMKFRFEDARLPEMLFRYRARNFPDTLDSSELNVWRQFCRKRLFEVDGHVNIARFNESLKLLRLQYGNDNAMLRALSDYADKKTQAFADIA